MTCSRLGQTRWKGSESVLPSVAAAYDRARSRLDADPYAAWTAAVWRHRNDWDERPCPEVGQLRGYLDGVPDEQRTEALQDLIAEHLGYAWKAGQGTRLDAYLSEFGHEFPDIASPTVVPADLVEDEFLARYAFPYGDTPVLDEYEERFPSRIDVMSLLQRRCLDEGRYVKLQMRGQGAMGEVFEAYDHHLCRFVAIKQPREGSADSGLLLRRFAEEALITAGLEHPAIVSVHEHHQSNASPFYVMRLADGQTLGESIRDYYLPPIDRARDEQRLFWNQLLQAFASACDAMAYAHARGVLHCDLKPGNIIVGQFGETAILDWGMAKRMAPLATCSSTAVSPPQDDVLGEVSAAEDCETLTSTIVAGTPQYMPPEQADGITDERSDVFGLGAVLYEMLTSRPPYAWPEGTRPVDWQRVVREARFVAPRRLRAQTPRSLEAICLKALARQPADRFQSAAELGKDVRRYLADEPVVARGERFLVTRWRALRRCRV